MEPHEITNIVKEALIDAMSDISIISLIQTYPEIEDLYDNNEITTEGIRTIHLELIKKLKK